MYYLGVDIGGTKSAVCIADETGRILKKEAFETAGPEETIPLLIDAAHVLLQGDPVKSIGISCGSPQDPVRGLILEPPNLPGWKEVPVTKLFSEAFSAPAFLMNDANSGALAEWKFGAGKGAKNMIFLTFGTGLGAGVILDGKLYEGTSFGAGETGHLRLEKDGPVGYGKKGSFEGFCSGGGLKQLGEQYARRALEAGTPAAYCRTEADIPSITAKSIALAAREGDETAKEVYRECGRKFGQGLAALVDLYNPEVIVAGSIFARSGDLLREEMEKTLREEALPQNLAVCKIVPAELGESIGDVSAIAVAMLGLEKDSLFGRYPVLESCREAIDEAGRILVEAAKADRTVLVCGNGGSAADSEHIVGELMKGFRKKRPVSEAEKQAYREKFGEEMPAFQEAVRAISLPSQSGILSAFANDVSAEDVYAQLAYGYAREGDVLIAISTSGNSKNCVSAAKAALMRGAKVIALTGEKESKLSDLATVTIRVPETETYKVQEYHLPVYHELCLRVEEAMFEK